MAHPMASQAKASQARRLSKLGGKAGKSYGSSSMYKKTSYPKKNAGTERPMTIEGGSAKKRADQPAKYASGGLVSGKPKAKAKPHATTNIVIANGGRSGRNRNRGMGNRPVPVPVPVPVGGGPGIGAPPSRPPVVVAGGGGPGPMGPPPGPPPGAAAMGPMGPMRPPGLASGGLAGPSYHNWGEGYKEGGVVKKADGGAVEKKAIGGAMLRRGNRPGAFKPGAIPGQPVVPLAGAKKPSPFGAGLGLKDGGKKADGGSVKHDDAAQDKKLFKQMYAKAEKKEKYADGGFVPSDQDSDDPGLEGSKYRNQGTGFNKGGFVKKAGAGSGLGRKAAIPAAAAVPEKTEV